MLDSNITRRSALGVIASTAGLAACKMQEQNAQSPVPNIDSSLPVGERIPAMLASMSTTQKVEQMIIPSLRYSSVDQNGGAAGITDLPPEAAAVFARHGFGGVLLYGDNIQSNEQTVRLVTALQEANRPADMPGRTALLVATDQEGGYTHRLANGCHMCGNMALGATNDEQSTRMTASVIADELSALGINTNLAPVVDINSNPNNPVIGVRSFGDTPELVSKMGCAYIEGLHEHGIVACAKHFPGHGDTEVDSHTGLPRLESSLDELRERELIPFATAVSSQVDMVLTAHIVFPSIDSTVYTSKNGSQTPVPATLSKVFVNDILRGELGYAGVVCTDSLVMDAILKNFDMLDVARLAIEAGVDILLEPIDPNQALQDYLNALESYVASLAKLVDDGTIPMQLVDDAVTRILSLKANHGLLDDQSSAIPIEQRIAHAKESVGSQSHHDIERQVALGAVTLVQNDGTLPVAQDESALVLVPYESQVTAAEYAVSQLQAAPSVTVLCYDTIDDASFAARYEEALKTSSVVILVSSAYDQKDLDNTSNTFIDDVISQCAQRGVRTAVISSQLPYDLERYTQAGALLACYYAAGMKTIPTSYDGEVAGWGPNLIAALTTALGGASPEGILPVSIGRDGNIVFDQGWGMQF